MANRKITELNALTGANATDTDVFAIVDVSADETKKITLGEFKNALDTGSGFVRITGDTMTGPLDVQSTITADGLTVEANTATFSAGTSGDMEVVIQADTDNNNEGDSPSLVFKQDGANTIGRMGLVGNSDDVFTGSISNSLYIGNDENAHLQIYTNLTQRVRVANNGDISFYNSAGTSAQMVWDASAESLGIGTSSPSLGSNGSGLHIKGASGDYGVLKVDSSTTSEEGWVQFSNNGVDKFRIASDSSTNLKFIHSGVAERMRITSAGNLLVGTTDDVVWNNSAGTSADNGHNLRSDGRAGFSYFNSTANANATVNVNRTGSDGDLLRLFKDGSTVGSIASGSSGNEFKWYGAFASGAGLGIYSNVSVRPLSNTGAASDGTVTLGHSSQRFKDLYLSGGVSLDGSSGNTLYKSGSDLVLNNRANATMIFGTNNTERMRITSAGSVGIGTSSPSVPLHINTSGTSMARFVGGNDGNLYITNDSANVVTLQAAGGDALSFNTNGGNERLRITSAGNVGIGTSSPSSFFSGASQLVVGSGSGAQGITIYSANNDNAQIFFADGTTGDEVYRGILRYRHDNDAMTFHTAGVTERMRIDSSGNVGINASTVSPIGSSNTTLQINGANTTDAGCLRLRSTNGGVDAAFWANSSAAYFGTISNDPLTFRVNNSERMRIDSSGNLLVGKTSASSNVVGVMAKQDGFLAATSDGDFPLLVNRLTSDGDIAVFRKDGATVGSIGSATNAFYLSSSRNELNLGSRGATQLYMDVIGGVALSPSTTYNGTADLGRNTAKFKDLYLSGGVYLGGTGAANKLDDYESGTFTPTLQGLSSAGSASYSVRDGRYTKVGRQIHVEITINATNFSGSGDFLVSGLPFAYASTAATVLFTAQWNNSPFADYPDDKQQVVGIGSQNTKIQFRASSNNYNTTHSQLQCKGGLASVGYLRLSGVYTTD